MPISETPCVQPEKAELYDSQVDRYAAISAAILMTFDKTLEPCDDEKQQFIDIGCGPGSFTLKYLLPSVLPIRRLVAVDKKEAMFKLAEEKYAHPNIEYLQLDILGNMDEFVRKQGQFKRVYSFLMLQWIRDQSLAMRNIEKLLTPGGECLLLFERSLHFFDLFVEMMKSPRWSKYSHVLQDLIPETHKIKDVSTLRTYAYHLVTSSKLIPLTCEVLTFPTLPRWNKEKMIEGFLSFNPVYLLISDEEKQELLAFIRDFTETLFTNQSDKESESRLLLVIHAFKPKK